MRYFLLTIAVLFSIHHPIYSSGKEQTSDLLEISVWKVNRGTGVAAYVIGTRHDTRLAGLPAEQQTLLRSILAEVELGFFEQHGERDEETSSDSYAFLPDWFISGPMNLGLHRDELLAKCKKNSESLTTATSCPLYTEEEYKKCKSLLSPGWLSILKTEIPEGKSNLLFDTIPSCTFGDMTVDIGLQHFLAAIFLFAPASETLDSSLSEICPSKKALDKPCGLLLETIILPGLVSETYAFTIQEIAASYDKIMGLCDTTFAKAMQLILHEALADLNSVKKAMMHHRMRNTKDWWPKIVIAMKKTSEKPFLVCGGLGHMLKETMEDSSIMELFNTNSEALGITSIQKYDYATSSWQDYT